MLRAKRDSMVGNHEKSLLSPENIRKLQVSSASIPFLL
jgi:hypothetical protein